jgi:hypothetical protein
MDGYLEERNTLKHGLALVCIILIGLVAVASAIPSIPAEFYGDLTIGNGPAPAGTVITARISGVECGSIVTTAAGTYGGPDRYDQRLAVVPDEMLLESSSNPQITFFVNNVQATPTATFISGESHRLDISAPASAGLPVVTIPTPAVISGGGGGSSGGGGGGFSGSTSGVVKSSQPGVTLKPTPMIQDQAGEGNIPLDAGGSVLERTIITSSDSAANLLLEKGTRINSLSGVPVGSIELKGPDISGILIPNESRVEFTGIAYDCQPDDVTFDSAVTLTFTLQDAMWENLQGTPLVVRWFNRTTQIWEDTPTTVDYVNHSVSVRILHFSVYGIFRSGISSAIQGTDTSNSTQVEYDSEKAAPFSLSLSPGFYIVGTILLFGTLIILHRKKRRKI